MEKEEEEVEKARKEKGRREVTVAVKIVRRSEKEEVRQVTRDGGDRDLRMRDQDIAPESTRLEASQDAANAETDNTPYVNADSKT